nr:uncharacterized protein LOC100176114 [Ciona intestinalis]|eukprot:XP_002130451.2 uncharacterized protein LOC100176114 [Ciona intestinalis]
MSIGIQYSDHLRFWTGMLDSKSNLNSANSHKMSWADVNIQGDYDLYARSPVRRANKDEAQTQKVSESNSSNPSPRNENSTRSVQDRSGRQRKPRVKLSKSPAKVQEQDVEKKNQDAKIQDTEKVFGNTDKLGDNREKDNKSKIHENLNFLRPKFVDSPDNDIPDNKETNILSDCMHKAGDENHKFNNNTLSKETSPHQNRKGKQKRTPQLHAPGNPFSPPVASVIHFRPPVEMGAINNSVQRRFVIRNGILMDDLHTKENLTRRSAIFMAKYLGMGYDPLPNRVTSIVVRPMLPPLKRRQEGFAIRDRPKIAQDEQKQEKIETELGPLRVSDAYNSRRNYAIKSRLQESDNTNLESRLDETEIFDHIVRWRSKVRHCGKPAMYRRVTSPTLGEVALRRKLTDRLPTRQVRRNWRGLPDIQSSDLDRWRQPASVLGVHTSQPDNKHIRENPQDDIKHRDSPDAATDLKSRHANSDIART